MSKDQTSKPPSFHRIHALTNTFSGIAGESRVVAEFIRCGLRVAKPYWSDNEADLLILQEAGQRIVPLVVQVKSVQFIPKNGKVPRRVFIQRLKKRYVERSPHLCLAIYRVDTDEIFFIDGAENIKSVYSSQKAWHKHIPLANLSDADDVRIGIDYNDGISGDWTVPRNTPQWLTSRVMRIAQIDANVADEVARLQSLWRTSETEDANTDSEPQEELVDASATPETEPV